LEIWIALLVVPRRAPISSAISLHSSATSGRRCGSILYAGPDTLKAARQRPEASKMGTATPLNPSSSSPSVDPQPADLTRSSSEPSSSRFVIVRSVNAFRGFRGKDPRVEVPVRVVGCEHKHVFEAVEEPERLTEFPSALRFVQGLGSEAHVLAHCRRCGAGDSRVDGSSHARAARH
jgi:hypothetical protein